MILRAFLLILISSHSVYAVCQTTDQRKEALRIATAQAWLQVLCAPANANLANPAEFRGLIEKWAVSDQSDCQGDKKIPQRLDLKQFVPGVTDRLLRAMQFRTEIQQTPDYVYGVPENSPAGTAAAFHANPDHGIFGYGGPIHFDELYVPSDQRTALCDALSKVGYKMPEDEITAPLPDNSAGADQISAEKPSASKSDNSPEAVRDHTFIKEHCGYDYLTTYRWRDRFARLSSTVTLDIRVVQVPLFQSGIILAPDSPSRAKWSPTITGSFDISKLYRSSDELKSISNYTKFNHAEKGKLLRSICEDFLEPGAEDRCIRRLAVGGYIQRSFISLFPTINVTVTTPFDLAKYGNIFIAPPNKGGSSLYTVTLNWGLHGAIPSAKDRIAALQNLTGLTQDAQDTEKDKKTKDSQKTNTLQKRKEVARLFVELASNHDKAIDKDWWPNLLDLISDLLLTP